MPDTCHAQVGTAWFISGSIPANRRLDKVEGLAYNTGSLIGVPSIICASLLEPCRTGLEVLLPVRSLYPMLRTSAHERQACVSYP